MKKLILRGFAIVLGFSFPCPAFAEGEVSPAVQDPGVIQETITLKEAQKPGQVVKDVAQMAAIFAAVDDPSTPKDIFGTVTVTQIPNHALFAAEEVETLPPPETEVDPRSQDITHSLYYLAQYGVDLSGTGYVREDGSIKPQFIDPNTGRLYENLLNDAKKAR